MRPRLLLTHPHKVHAASIVEAQVQPTHLRVPMTSGRRFLASLPSGVPCMGKERQPKLCS